MDTLREVIIDNKIYSARYGQPPRDIDAGDVEAEDDEVGEVLRRDGSLHDEPEALNLLETMTHQRTCDSPAVASVDDAILPFAWFQGPRPQHEDGALMTTDLDELPISEPDYINLRNDRIQPSLDDAPRRQSILKQMTLSQPGRKTFTNSLGQEENIYEEINELQKRLAMEQQSTTFQTHQVSPNRLTGAHRRGSLVDEVLDEVARVRLRHDSVLNQLNLDLEHFLKPQSPDLDSTASFDWPARTNVVEDDDFGSCCDAMVDLSSVSATAACTDVSGCESLNPIESESACVNNFCDTLPASMAPPMLPPPPPPFSQPQPHNVNHVPNRRKMTSHTRSISSVNFGTSSMHWPLMTTSSSSSPLSLRLSAGVGERPIARCESLDFNDAKDALCRRQSITSRASTSSISSNRSEGRGPNHSHSIRNLQLGLQQGIQGLADWTEKCGILLAKRSKKMMAIVNKDRRSACDGAGEPVLPDAADDNQTCFSVSNPVKASSTNGSDVVDNDSQIYEDIDQNSVGSTAGPDKEAAADSGFSSRRTTAVGGVRAASSDDSWGSGEFESFSSDAEDDDSEKINSPARATSLRALLTTKSIRSKWRSRSREEERKISGSDTSSNSTIASRIASPSTCERRFSRLFSLRRPSSSSLVNDAASSTAAATAGVPAGHLNTLNGAIGITPGTADPKSSSATLRPLPQLLEEEEMMAGLGIATGGSGLGSLFQRRHQPPTLPPMPANLSPEQIKRRYIVATIIHSENSYVASLQRLVNDYKKPLEESNPPILGASKIATLFHRVQEILQCHTLFRLALSECVRSWDKEEKIGDVFVASFSKAVVLDIYSDFINNFSLALDVAKQESKRKSALADFLKVKQISSHDRLSFFGLMVKPVQRFPQFILLLQDLLKHTPQGHPDRMSLQLALTQLESMAELLNERKRESEQYQAFRDTLRRVSGKFSLRPLADNNRYLLRQDNVTLVEFNQSGMIAKTKERRLLLLNDLLVCVTVVSKSGDDFRNSERLTLKWAFPITDIEVEDTSTSPTLSRLLSSGSNIRSSEAINGVDNLCQEMNHLMHDYDVITRIASLINSLHGQYEFLDRGTTQSALSQIQQKLQRKDEEMAWIDACCLQLVIRNRSGKEEKFTFQTDSPDTRKDWIIELRLAQLALDPKNSPSWDVPEQERRPSTKLPLYVKSLPVYRSHHATEVRCGCFYTTAIQKTGPSVRYLGPRFQNFLWIVSADGISSHVTLFTTQQPIGPSLKEVGSFSLVEVKVTSAEFSPGTQLRFEEEPGKEDKFSGDLVWLGTESRRIMLFSAQEPDKGGQIGSLCVPASVVQLRYHCDQMFVALANGTVAIFKRNMEGAWDLNAPATLVTLGEEPVICLLPIGSSLYAACGRNVFVLDGVTGETLRNFSVQQDHPGTIQAMAHSGIGLWISLRNNSIVCLYHTETFRHLQDINVASNVSRILGNNHDSRTVKVTTLAASKGLLWVGTNTGIALTIPLPRLEGVPIISGRANVSYHAHSGPITFFLTLQIRTRPVLAPPAISVVTQPQPRETIQEESENESASSHLEINGKSTANNRATQFNTVPKVRTASVESPLTARRKAKEASPSFHKRMTRTLPRSHATLSATECDIFGLYGELMNVKDYEEAEGTGLGGTGTVNSMYETLRRSDPDLAAIPAKVSTLDRRLHMKAARPRSLDLSNWSVDSRSSMYTTSSGSEDSASHTIMANSMATHSQNSTVKRLQKNGDGLKSGLDAPRTVFTLSGGRGYLHLHKNQDGERKNSTPSPANTTDSHIILWEMKL